MAESRTAIAAAFVGNGALAVLKGVVAGLTGSSAMLAEMFHSIGDTGNQVLLFLGLRLSQRPPDRDHPFGHGKNVYFWGFVVAVMLFSLGGALSIWEGVKKITGGEAGHQSFFWAYVVLGGGFVFEAGSLFVAVRSFLRQKGSMTVRRYVAEQRDPTLLTVLMEDAAALLSLVIAAAGIFAAQQTGSAVWDGLASGLIGLMLIGVALLLAVENHSLLLGEAAASSTIQAIREAIDGERAIVRLTSLHTMHVGPDAVLVAIGAKFQDRIDVAQIERAVGRVHQQVDAELGRSTSHRLILVEPSGPDDRASTPDR